MAGLQELIGKKEEVPRISKLERHIGRPCPESLIWEKMRRASS